MLNRFFIASYIFWVFLLVGCKPIQSSAIHDTTCAPPCWEGVEPGQTSREEALTILNALPEVDHRSIKIMSIVHGNDTIRWEFMGNTGDFFADIFLINDVVLAINIFPNEQALPLATAFECLGEPESILVLNDNAEVPSVSIFLGYPSKGVILLSSVDPFYRDEQIVISADTLVWVFWYFEPVRYNELMTSKYIADIDPNQLIEDTHLWTGYGDVSEFIVDWR